MKSVLPPTCRIRVPPLRILMRSLLQRSHLPNCPYNQRKYHNVRVRHFNVLLRRLQEKNIRNAPANSFPFPLPSRDLLTCPSTPLRRVLVMRRRILFRSNVKGPTKINGLQRHSVQIALRRPSNLDVLFLTKTTHTTQRPIASARPVTRLLTPFSCLKMIHAQLPTRVHTFRPRFAYGPVYSVLPRTSVMSLCLAQMTNGYPQDYPGLVYPTSSLLRDVTWQTDADSQ